MRAERRPADRNRQPHRDLTSLRELSRMPVLSYAQKAVDPRRPRVKEKKAPHPKLHKLEAFLPWNVFKWAREYLRHRIGYKHAFQTYGDASDNGIYPVPDNVTVVMTGDWGTGTDEAAAVADQIEQSKPDITIHLGDVYYVGDADELRENCLGEKNPENHYAPVTWPHGELGSFALNGNHEMYARGMAYFDVFLPTLGMGNKGQRASFFCIENKHWRLIALDTGYNSVGIPILELIPIVSKVNWIGGDCAQEDAWLEWLAKAVQPEGDNRALILLSHHQYYSAFDGREYPRPAQQLAQHIKRPVLWFWGHEHRLAAYDEHRKGEGIVAIGRCIGNGGMPIERNPTVTDDDAHKALKFFDNRQYDNGEGIDVGFNGFACLEFKGDRLTVRYLDLNGDEALYEEWTTSAGSPKLVTFRPALAASAPGRR
jgi:hypothetical protein